MLLFNFRNKIDALDVMCRVKYSWCTAALVYVHELLLDFFLLSFINFNNKENRMCQKNCFYVKLFISVFFYCRIWIFKMKNSIVFKRLKCKTPK